MTITQRRRCIVHVVYSFSVGGLENVIVQLINHLPADKFEHVVLSLTTISDFKQRIVRPNVRFIELHKASGHAVPLYPRIYRLLRDLQPDVVHTCNLAPLELMPLAWLARVPMRIHGEHGWDVHDPQGRNPRYQFLRKLYKPFVHHYVAVSKDIDSYLARAIGVPSRRRSIIANGVDTDIFFPAVHQVEPVSGCPFVPGLHWLIGTVGRLQTVKNQPLLAKAFVRLLQTQPELAERARLVVVGEGPLRTEVESVLNAAGLLHLAWLPGARGDVAAILRMLNVFVLPSQAEGTSCTLQEAMACGLPVVATAVGGSPELVQEDVTGHLVPANDEQAMMEALRACFTNPQRMREFGRTARATALAEFGLEAMVARYSALLQRSRVS